MADQTTRTESTLLGTVATPFRLCFPALAEPQNRNGKLEYNCSLVAEKDGELHQALRAMVLMAAAARFGGKDKALAGLKSGFIENPILDGEYGNYADRPGFGPGVVFVRAKTQNPPGVVGKNPKIAWTKDQIRENAYPGCYVSAVLHAYTYVPTPGKGSKNGVSIGLDCIQVVADGERLGGGTQAASAFPDLSASDVSDMQGGAGGSFENGAAPF